MWLIFDNTLQALPKHVSRLHVQQYRGVDKLVSSVTLNKTDNLAEFYKAPVLAPFPVNLLPGLVPEPSLYAPGLRGYILDDGPANPCYGGGSAL